MIAMSITQDQPSLVYVVEVDNKRPRSYQVLDLVGYPEVRNGRGRGGDRVVTSLC